MCVTMFCCRIWNVHSHLSRPTAALAACKALAKRNVIRFFHAWVLVILASHSYRTQVALQIERQQFIQSKIIDRVADENDDLVFVEQKKKLVVDVRDKDDLELYYKTIPDYFEQDDGRKLTEIPDRTSTDMIEGRY